jgi:hypothetical protein
MAVRYTVPFMLMVLVLAGVAVGVAAAAKQERKPRNAAKDGAARRLSHTRVNANGEEEDVDDVIHRHRGMQMCKICDDIIKVADAALAKSPVKGMTAEERQTPKNKRRESLWLQKLLESTFCEGQQQIMEKPICERVVETVEEALVQYLKAAEPSQEGAHRVCEPVCEMRRKMREQTDTITAKMRREMGLDLPLSQQVWRMLQENWLVVVGSIVASTGLAILVMVCVMDGYDRRNKMAAGRQAERRRAEEYEQRRAAVLQGLRQDRAKSE